MPLAPSPLQSPFRTKLRILTAKKPAPAGRTQPHPVAAPTPMAAPLPQTIEKPSKVKRATPARPSAKPEPKDEAKATTRFGQLPEVGFVRLPAILEVYPICRAAWWEGVKAKRLPQPVKLSARVTAWRVEDIRKLLGSALAEGK